MKFGIKKLVLLFLVAVLLSVNAGIVHSQVDTPTPTPTPSTDTTALQNQIKQYEQKISDLQGQENTLSSQIAIMDSQIKLTEYKIEATQEQITSLTLDIDTAGKKIVSLQSTLETSIGVLINRIIATYEVGTIQPFQILLTSNSASDFFSRLNYLKLAQAHDKQLIYDTQQAKTDYANQKNILQNEKAQVEQLKAQLQAQTVQLNQQKQAKQQILAETRGSESTYQQLLAQAKAELAGFSNFVDAAGASFANFGTGSNGWYYTQRDSQWGSMILPGSSSSVLLAGCAVTSVAMVCKSYGQNITPASIVSNSSKFINGDLWNWAFSCDGKTTDWIGSSQDQVKSYVQNGTPVILRLVAPSVSGLHFVVAWKLDGNDIIIHDPYYGPDKKFSDRYDWSQVTTAIVIH